MEYKYIYMFHSDSHPYPQVLAAHATQKQRRPHWCTRRRRFHSCLRAATLEVGFFRFFFSGGELVSAPNGVLPTTFAAAFAAAQTQNKVAFDPPSVSY
eukprot:COSAG01_NODE_2022_length_8630_cov_16.836010_2_plen_98_part_00